VIPTRSIVSSYFFLQIFPVINSLELVQSSKRTVTCAARSKIIWNRLLSGGSGSVVGIATAYGLDGPGIESQWGEIFHTSPDRP